MLYKCPIGDISGPSQFHMEELSYTTGSSLSLQPSAMPPLVNSRLFPWPENKSYDKQAIPVPGTKRPGQSRTMLTSGTYLFIPN